MFADPFDTELEKIVAKAGSSLQGGSKLHTRATHGDQDVTLVCMEGPCFSTRAESNMYRSLGGSVINMYFLRYLRLMIGLPFLKRNLLAKQRLHTKWSA